MNQLNELNKLSLDIVKHILSFMTVDERMEIKNKEILPPIKLTTKQLQLPLQFIITHTYVYYMGRSNYIIKDFLDKNLINHLLVIKINNAIIKNNILIGNIIKSIKIVNNHISNIMFDIWTSNIDNLIIYNENGLSIY